MIRFKRPRSGRKDQPTIGYATRQSGIRWQMAAGHLGVERRLVGEISIAPCDELAAPAKARWLESATEAAHLVWRIAPPSIPCAPVLLYRVTAFKPDPFDESDELPAIEARGMFATYYWPDNAHVTDSSIRLPMQFVQSLALGTVTSPHWLCQVCLSRNDRFSKRHHEAPKPRKILASEALRYKAERNIVDYSSAAAMGTRVGMTVAPVPDASASTFTS
ncbi:hypothetical protein CABS01_11741 [Colletotrichum abscissum]|uniref:Uncharacterized protein n=1 Tax=Colletotrichum abscissum TaxID=1671311 RepID=A0A9Q0AZG7_9PEZI|nr:uncharacterized protein CABS01_11741 [Colletotrichum abscissum]KAI3548677.1 hypothetical protein CABS02_08207 [Colletotrichum abscissum]KAK1492844.1 hypothetical protein CABS01_11741 [Colletotrichum abscissum]